MSYVDENKCFFLNKKALQLNIREALLSANSSEALGCRKGASFGFTDRFVCHIRIYYILQVL